MHAFPSALCKFIFTFRPRKIVTYCSHAFTRRFHFEWMTWNTEMQTISIICKLIFSATHLDVGQQGILCIVIEYLNQNWSNISMSYRIFMFNTGPFKCDSRHVSQRGRKMCPGYVNANWTWNFSGTHTPVRSESSRKWETWKVKRKKKLELTACDEPVVGLARGRNRRLRGWLGAQILEVYDLQADVVHLAPY